MQGFSRHRATVCSVVPEDASFDSGEHATPRKTLFLGASADTAPAKPAPSSRFAPLCTCLIPPARVTPRSFAACSQRVVSSGGPRPAAASNRLCGARTAPDLRELRGRTSTRRSSRGSLLIRASTCTSLPTPTSWLNLVKRRFADTGQAIRRHSLGSIRGLVGRDHQLARSLELQRQAVPPGPSPPAILNAASNMLHLLTRPDASSAKEGSKPRFRRLPQAKSAELSVHQYSAWLAILT